MIIGTGEYRYELIEDWEQLPDGLSHPDVVSVKHCHETDDIFVFNRSETPVLRYRKSGEFVDAWGGEYFTEVRGPHGMFLEGDQRLLLVDMRRNCVERYSYDGQRLDVIPREDLSSGELGPAFDKPTGVVVHPNGNLYVSDGYGNSLLHRYGATGRWRATWGCAGDQPMEFAIPHSVVLSPEGNLLVADRENHRIQVISPDGEFLGTYEGVFRPCAIHVAPTGEMYVAELGADTATRLVDRPVPSRVTVLRPDGSVAARIGSPDPLAKGGFVAAHDITVDDEGSIYVAEVTWTMGVNKGLAPDGTHTLQKFARL